MTLINEFTQLSMITNCCSSSMRLNILFVSARKVRLLSADSRMASNSDVRENWKVSPHSSSSICWRSYWILIEFAFLSQSCSSLLAVAIASELFSQFKKRIFLAKRVDAGSHNGFVALLAELKRVLFPFCLSSLATSYSKSL